jgi:hypothetical protein
MEKNRRHQSETNKKKTSKRRVTQSRGTRKSKQKPGKRSLPEKHLRKRHQTVRTSDPVRDRNGDTVTDSVPKSARDRLDEPNRNRVKPLRPASAGQRNAPSIPVSPVPLRKPARKPVPRACAKHQPEAEPRNSKALPRVREGRTVERRKSAQEGTRKQRGEISESQFFAKAVHMGFGVAKPWGDSDPYDFILDAGGARLQRVQLKSAFKCSSEGGYTTNATGNDYTRPYTKDDVDVLVAYIVPEDAWYIIPIEAFEDIGGMKLFPASRRRRSRFEKYREAWCLLSCKKERLKRRPRLRVCWKCGSSGRCVVK